MVPYAMEVEYLQSTATSGFNIVTNNEFPVDCTFELKYKIDNILTQTTYQSYFTRETDVNRTPTVYMGARPNGYYYCSKDTSGGQKYLLRIDGRNTNVHTLIVDFENKTISLDGAQSAFATSFTQYTVPSRMCLFKGIDSTYVGLYGKIYYFKITKNNQVLLDLIPIRIGTVGYMYDKITGQIFGNTEEGTFVYGPDVAPVIYANEVAFLESWGNQYIDTGIKPSTDTKIELKCLYCKSGAGLTNYGALIGADDRDNAYILNHSAVANFTYGLEFSNNFANPQTRLLTFDSTASPQNMRVYDEGGSLVTTLTCLRGVFEVNQNLYLFAVNRNGTPVYGSNRILYCKIYDGDTLVRDYVPVEYNGIGYMYDKVSGLFFDNQGTGRFLFGSIAKACARSYTRRQLLAKAPVPLKNQYLTFKVLSGGTITAVSTNAGANRTIQYSLNGGRWQSLAISTTSQSLGTFNIDDEIRIKGNNSSYAIWIDRYCHFAGTAQTEVKGNIMSLVYGDNFVGKTVLTANYTFIGLFQSWTNLVSAEDLIMPAMTLRDRCYIYLFKGCSSLQKTPKILPAANLAPLCYYEMFNGCKKIVYPPIISAVNASGDSCCLAMFAGCSALKEAPDLNATTLSPNCYSRMFYGCSALTKAPDILPATTLKSNCYAYMFYECTSLVTAPVLPALTLVSGCHDRMFMNDKKLRYIKAMFTTTPSSATTINWVYGIPSGGTFVKNSAATWDVTGVSGIPSGWTVQTADE